MADSHDADAQIGMQYLVWALELIEKTGNEKAARHARIALKALREGSTESSGENPINAWDRVKKPTRS